MDNTLSDAIADYIEQRKQTKLEPLSKALNKVLDKSDDPAFFKIVAIICLLIKQLLFLDLGGLHQLVHSS
ncbi:hypothetical protein [Vibrio navarrensis]|uniref:hypothetical protein n=1 Tax=Vibrio navarrensis TaxID=29495 RepID=UPI0018DEC769|nr:hypothetical protein [Vibrio navarrensis]MBH9742075.1 hypothetical protein [Vibrio navarrensis]